MTDSLRLYEEAQDALSVDPVAAASLYRPAADAGDAGARFKLAVVLSESDRPAAIEILRSLDSDNFDGASYRLAALYWLVDSDAAKYWFRRAAERDDPCSTTAALNLGMLQCEGTSTEVEEAEKWLRVVLDRGDQRARFWLGVALEDKNPDEALGLYVAAIKDGVTAAHHRAGGLLLKRGDDEGARRMYEMGVDAGDVRSMVGLFNVYKGRKPLLAARWLYRSLRSGGFGEYREAQERRKWASGGNP